jgi:6-phosphogluconolactonase
MGGGDRSLDLAEGIRMTDLVCADAGALAEAAAAWIVETFAALPGRITVSLAGGSTPKRLYETLASPEFAAQMPWDRVHWFWGDERFVPPEDTRSNQSMVRGAMLDRVPVPAANIHPVPTTGMTATEAAVAYEAVLRGFQEPGRPLFDLVLLGLGTNGHTASLFPHEAVLTERTAWAAAVTPPNEPTRITLTWPPLEDCRHAAFLVVGSDKREVVQAVRGGDMELPAAHYRPHGALMWWMDAAAAGA